MELRGNYTIPGTEMINHTGFGMIQYQQQQQKQQQTATAKLQLQQQHIFSEINKKYKAPLNRELKSARNTKFYSWKLMIDDYFVLFLQRDGEDGQTGVHVWKHVVMEYQ